MNWALVPKLILFILVAQLSGCKVSDGKSEQTEYLKTDRTDISYDGTVRCRLTSGHECDGEVCTKIEPKITIAWNKKEQTYQRCDKSGCTKVAVQASSSGAFTNVHSQNGMMAKFSSKGTMLEVATLLDYVLVYRGLCEPGG